MEKINKYYVYIFVNPIDNIPFYVGKGTNNRHRDHKKNYRKNIEYWEESKQPIALKDATFQHLDSLGLEHKTEIVGELSEGDAFILEHAFIAWFGRRIYGNGVLTNKLSGGRQGSAFFDDQSLIELYRRPDLLEHLLKWPKLSKPWPVKALFLYEGENDAAYGFVEIPINDLYYRFSFEELGAKTIELLKHYDSVITPLYWVRKVNYKKKIHEDLTYIMHEGLDMFKDYCFSEKANKNFDKFLLIYKEFTMKS